MTLAGRSWTPLRCAAPTVAVAILHVNALATPVTWTPATHTLLLGPPTLVTKANVNRLDF